MEKTLTKKDKVVKDDKGTDNALNSFLSNNFKSLEIPNSRSEKPLYNKINDPVIENLLLKERNFRVSLQ